MQFREDSIGGNDGYAILDCWNARRRACPQRPELGYGGDPASPLQAIQGSARCCGGDSRGCIRKRHLHRPAGLFVSVSIRPRLQSFGPRIAGQFAVEFAVALGLSLLLLAIPLRSSIQAASFLGLAGLIAGVETHFPNWNWVGFPTSYLLAGSAYLAGNWFITGLVVGAVRRKLKAEGVAR